MAVKIITDSLGDIPSEVAKELGITVVPLDVHFGTQTFRDGVDLTAERFYDKLVHSKIFPTTTVQHLSVFVSTYEKLAEETDEIIVITFSRKLGASYAAALEAKELMIECLTVVFIFLQGFSIVSRQEAKHPSEFPVMILTV